MSVKLFRCGEWDPCSLDEKNLASLFELGTVAKGRDKRRWSVVETKDKRHPNKPATRVWALCPEEQKIERVVPPLSLSLSSAQRRHRSQTKDSLARKHKRALKYRERSIPLFKLHWWVWSTLTGIEYFAVYDCGGKGDCFFLCVSKALNHMVVADPVDFLGVGTLRKWAGSRIQSVADTNNILPVLHEKHCETTSTDTEDKESGDSKREPGSDDCKDDFPRRREKVADQEKSERGSVSVALLQENLRSIRHGTADEESHAVLSHARQVVRRWMMDPHCYWGDTHTIELLCQTELFKELAVGFLLFKPSGVVDAQYITSVPANQVERVIMLYNDTDTHWRLVLHQDKFFYRRRKTLAQLDPSLQAILEASWQREWKTTFGFS